VPGVENRNESKTLEPHEERLVEIISSLDVKYPDLVIIVEGIRDEKLLRSLGVQAAIIRTQSGLSRPQLIERIASTLGESKRVLILTDFDDEGKELASFLKSELELIRAKILERERHQIGRNMGSLRCIEELVMLFKRQFSPEPA